MQKGLYTYGQKLKKEQKKPIIFFPTTSPIPSKINLPPPTSKQIVPEFKIAYNPTTGLYWDKIQNI